MRNKSKKIVNAEATEKQRMPIDEYRKMLKGFKLVSVSLASCDAKADTSIAEEAFSQAEPLPVDIDDRTATQRNDSKVIISHNYKVSTKYKRKKIFELNATFSVEFEATEGFSEEFYEIFKESSLRLMTWPYLREFVASMTGRMQLPPLHLGLWHVPSA